MHHASHVLDAPGGEIGWALRATKKSNEP